MVTKLCTNMRAAQNKVRSQRTTRGVARPVTYMCWTTGYHALDHSLSLVLFLLQLGTLIRYSACSQKRSRPHGLLAVA